MPSIGSDNLGPAYWRSLDELADTPAFRAFVEREFPAGATEWLSGPSRRQFLKVMGASFALAGLAACRWPEERIVPHVHRPEGHMPGVPERYATAMERSGVATGFLVTSYDGRPIKVEGNPLHPDSRGATDAPAQASILELYDPDRSQRVVRRDGGQRIVSGWEDFVAFAQAHFSELKTRQGDGLAILSEATASPSAAAMRARLGEVLPKASWYEFEPVSRDNERAGTRLAFGEPLRMHLALDEAAVIACFDADLLLRHPAAVGYTRDFAKGRAGCDEGRMSRLYVAESSFSLT
ncbi:MAG: TAT-variant-translocated molybdopterin oxidoreductase, partial [Phycisphaerae bacterium]|nr:TAT-variant-translocated molybdopterin oxidoreductase [Phycisphaerae bacterium]